MQVQQSLGEQGSLVDSRSVAPPSWAWHPASQQLEEASPASAYCGSSGNADDELNKRGLLVPTITCWPPDRLTQVAVVVHVNLEVHLGIGEQLTASQHSALM